MRTLSLFSGCLGLDLGLEAVGAEPVAYVENDDACQRVIYARRPGVPILGDVREVDESVGPVDLLAGGFPCQDLSYAGKGAGLDGERSGLWHEMARAVRVVRPRLVLVENVPALATRGLGRVLYDLAEAGYVGSWLCLRAADVGAPHGRDRLFILARAATDTAGLGRGPGAGLCAAAREDGDARLRRGRLDDDRSEAPADADGRRWEGEREQEPPGLEGARRGEPDGRDPAGRLLLDTAAAPADTDNGAEHGERPRTQSRQGGPATPDADGAGRSERGGAVAARSQHAAAERSGTPPADAAGIGRERWESRARVDGQRGHPAVGAEGVANSRVGGGAAGGVDGDPVQWGVYEPAIRRWERAFGRPAPRPTDDRGRLSPRFVEWMLGFPDGWVDVPGAKRTAQLRMLGNAVQVQVAAAAGALLVEGAL